MNLIVLMVQVFPEYRTTYVIHSTQNATICGTDMPLNYIYQ